MPGTEERRHISAEEHAALLAAIEAAFVVVSEQPIYSPKQSASPPSHQEGVMKWLYALTNPLIWGTLLGLAGLAIILFRPQLPNWLYLTGLVIGAIAAFLLWVRKLWQPSRKIIADSKEHPGS